MGIRAARAAKGTQSKPKSKLVCRHWRLPILLAPFKFRPGTDSDVPIVAADIIKPASHAGCGPESICLLKSCRLFNITTCKAWTKMRFYHSLYKFPKDVVNPLVILKVAKTEVKSLRTKPSDSSFFKQQCCPRNLALNGKSEV